MAHLRWSPTPSPPSLDPHRRRAEVVAAEGADGLERLRLRDTATGDETAFDATGLFIAIGHDPRSELVDRRYRQAVTAAGTGCAAALDAEHHVAERGLATPVEEQAAIILETPSV